MGKTCHLPWGTTRNSRALQGPPACRGADTCGGSPPRPDADWLHAVPCRNAGPEAEPGKTVAGAIAHGVNVGMQAVQGALGTGAGALQSGLNTSTSAAQGVVGTARGVASGIGQALG